MARRRQSTIVTSVASTQTASAQTFPNDPSRYPSHSKDWLREHHPLLFGGKNRTSDPGGNFFSNFYPAPFDLDGLSYYHAEGAFQAAKFIGQDEEVTREIADARAPAEAKWLGRAHRMGDAEVRAWQEGGADAAMRRVVEAKFAEGSAMAERLLETGNRTLVEATRDRLWGAVKGVGQNKLGVALMARRAELAGKKVKQ